MNGLREKFRNKKGFTLIEMLIVVAIIAILIAISIPMVAGALEKSREATDAANERSFKAELTIAYLTGVTGTGATDTFAVGTVYAYDANAGQLVNDAPDKPYGQATSSGKNTHDHQGMVLYGNVDADGNVYMGWSKDKVTAAYTADSGNKNLCGGAELYETKATTPVGP